MKSFFLTLLLPTVVVVGQTIFDPRSFPGGAARPTAAARTVTPSQAQQVLVEEPGPLSQTSTLTTGVPACDPSVRQHSGYVAFKGWDGTDKRYFFWMFESRSRPSEDPLVIWLQGGPGCSSMLAALTENGPCAANADGTGVTIIWSR